MELGYDSSFFDDFSNRHYFSKGNNLTVADESGFSQQVDLQSLFQVKSSSSSQNLIKNTIKFSSVLSGSNIHIHGGGMINS